MAEAMYEVRKYPESVAKRLRTFWICLRPVKLMYTTYANYALAYSAFGADQYKKAATYFEKFLDGEKRQKHRLTMPNCALSDSYFVLKSYGKRLDYYNRIIAKQGGRLRHVSAWYDPGFNRDRMPRSAR
jgi:hypothetical protein